MCKPLAQFYNLRRSQIPNILLLITSEHKTIGESRKKNHIVRTTYRMQFHLGESSIIIRYFPTRPEPAAPSNTMYSRRESTRRRRSCAAQGVQRFPNYGHRSADRRSYARVFGPVVPLSGNRSLNFITIARVRESSFFRASRRRTRQYDTVRGSTMPSI